MVIAQNQLHISAWMNLPFAHGTITYSIVSHCFLYSACNRLTITKNILLFIRSSGKLKLKLKRTHGIIIRNALASIPSAKQVEEWVIMLHCKQLLFTTSKISTFMQFFLLPPMNSWCLYVFYFVMLSSTWVYRQIRLLIHFINFHTSDNT